jgi:membrane protein implicated in regulation of membrane protease activity
MCCAVLLLDAAAAQMQQVLFPVLPFMVFSLLSLVLCVIARQWIRRRLH